MNPHSYRLKGRDFVHQGKIEIDVNERAVFIRTQGCFFVYTNSDCFLNSLLVCLHFYCLHCSSGLEIKIKELGGYGNSEMNRKVVVNGGKRSTSII